MTFAASFAGFACGGKFTVCSFLIDSYFMLPWPQFCNSINACPRGLEARICHHKPCLRVGRAIAWPRQTLQRKWGKKGWAEQEKLGKKSKARKLAGERRDFSMLYPWIWVVFKNIFWGQWGSLQKRLKPAQKSSYMLGCHFLNTAHVCSRPNTTGSCLEVGF